MVRFLMRGLAQFCSQHLMFIPIYTCVANITFKMERLVLQETLILPGYLVTGLTSVFQGFTNIHRSSLGTTLTVRPFFFIVSPAKHSGI